MLFIAIGNDAGLVNIDFHIVLYIYLCSTAQLR